MSNSFYYFENMVVNATDIPDLSLVTSMNSMFYENNLFNTNIDNWDVSNVTDMTLTFHMCQEFNQPLNSWDVSNVTEMLGLFQGCTEFNQPLDNWDVSNVTAMFSMFGFAENFNQQLNNWNISQVIDVGYMFYGAKNFNQPLNNWDTSQVTYLDGVFGFAEDFNQNINNWDISNVNSLWETFRNAISFSKPLNNWNTSNVQQTDQTFEGALSFNQSLNNWDMSSNTYMNDMFKNALSFNQDISSWNFDNSLFNFSESYENFVNNSGLDSENYDLLLSKFAFLNIQNGSLEAQGLYYCDEFIRQTLINNGWNITDEGLFNDCNNNIIRGFVNYDADDSGCNTNNLVISNYVLNIDNGSFNTSYLIDENGQYEAFLKSGNYTLNVLNVDSNFASSPLSQTVNFSGQGEIPNDVDFCISAIQQFEDLAIDIFPLDDAIPGFETDYQVIVFNNGTQTVSDVQITFEYESNFQSFVASTETPSGNTSGLLSFDFII